LKQKIGESKKYKISGELIGSQRQNILVANEMETRGEILWIKDMKNGEK
jgi:hypothetical protein